MVILNSNQQQIIGWLSPVYSGGGTSGTTTTTRAPSTQKDNRKEAVVAEDPRTRLATV